MPVPRLEQHYLRLMSQFPAGEVTTTLQALADTLCCSKRYMRALLVKMQQRGWLAWQASAGRGHLGHLALLCSPQQLRQEQAAQLLAAGDVAAAIALVSDRQQLAAMLQSRIGHRVRHDQQTLCVPYYRPMPCLLPGVPLRRSEQHLVRQIFSGLTRVTETGEAVTGDLAHSWRQHSATRWRFFLRPGVLFHDGRPLTSEDVVVSLRRCAALPLFSHLAGVTAQGALGVVITLSQPDPQLPQLLSDTAALILPADYAQRDDFASLPVGSGPYRIVVNSDWHLQLAVFEHYFGLRGLLDQIELIVLPDVAAGVGAAPFSQQAAWLSSSLSDIDYVSGKAADFTGLPSEPLPEMFIEQGGYFLLCDGRSACWQQPEARRWLREVLSPARLLQQMIAPVRPLWVPAASLLPQWQHEVEGGPSAAPFSPAGSQRTLRLAYHERHPEYPMLAGIIRQLLKEAGVSVRLISLDYARWAAGDAQADLWLGTVNFPRPVERNVALWLLGMPLLQYGLAGGDRVQQAEWREAWRGGRLSPAGLVEEGVSSGWVQPLFHHWMRLKGPDQAQNVRLNNLGWFEFATSWMEPQDDE